LRRLKHRRAALVSDSHEVEQSAALDSAPHTRAATSLQFVQHRRNRLAEASAPGRRTNSGAGQRPGFARTEEQEIAAVEQQLVRTAWEDEKVGLLMSIPRIDYTVAQTQVASRLEIDRRIQTEESEENAKSHLTQS
jgi:hypothetical protein